MRITIRVAAGNSAQVAQQVQQQLAGIKTAANGAGSAATNIFDSAKMEKFGKDLQWTGRQLEYRFSLPLVAAGGAAAKWALDNERALTQVRKVYGDLDMPISQVNSEVNSLAKGFRVLSDEFGVNQADVISMGAAWAQAGATGVALAKATRLTIEASILGDMDKKTAAESLIAIQNQYGLSTSQLKDALATLNVIENQTAVGFSDLILAMTRAGGTARTAGVDIRDLASLTAALVPATGGAEQAGNALKTIISRMMAPTKDMVSLFGELGINVGEADWQSKTFIGRLFELSGAYEKLTAPQQSVAGAVLASRFQVAKFDVLMRDLASSTGNYARAQDASRDSTRNMTLYNRELGIVLASQPQTIKILWTQIRNLASEAIVPLLPYLIVFIKQIVGMVQWFTHLSPAVQKAIFVGLGFIAVMGPLLAYLGSFITLGAQFLKVWEAIATRLIVGSGSVGASAGRMAGETVHAFEAVRQATVSGWHAIVDSDAAGWIARKVISAAGWIELQAQALFYWAYSLALEIAGWARRSAIAAAGWIALKAGAAGAWVSQLALEAAFWASSALEAAVGSAAVLAASIGWIPLLAVAVAAGMVFFSDQIGAGVRWVAERIGQLPAVFAAAFRGVISVVGRAARAVYDLLGYLNPFQRHSPSLVDNVIAGVDVIAAKYASLAGIGAIFRGVAADFKLMDVQFEPAQRGFKQADIEKKKAQILSYSPDAGPALDAFVPTLAKAEAILALITEEYSKQEFVVARWKTQLVAANEALEVQQQKLAILTRTASVWKSQLDQAKSTLSTLMQTPIAGTQAYTDAIFQNEMAQKSLRLEILRLEGAGKAIDDLRARMASLQGDIELLRGQQTELRRAGASAAILDPMDAQIKKMEAEQSKIKEQIKAGTALQDNLAKVQREGEILNLEQSLKFDPLKKQLAEVSQTIKEMPFDELLAKVKEQAAAVERLTPIWEQADAAVQQQQTVVEGLTVSRDALQKTYDVEKAKLDELGAAYDGVQRQIQDMNASLSGMAANASEASTALQNLADAALGDFEIPGGKNTIANEPGSIDDLVKQWQDELSKKFGKFDLIAPIRTAVEAVKNWAVANGPAIGAAVGLVLFGPIGAVAGTVLGGVFEMLVHKYEENGRKAKLWAKSMVDTYLNVTGGVQHLQETEGRLQKESQAGWHLTLGSLTLYSNSHAKQAGNRLAALDKEIKKQGDVANSVEAMATRYNTALDKTLGKLLTSDQATATYALAVDSLSRTIDTNASSTDTASVKQALLVQSLGHVISAAQDEIGTMTNANGTLFTNRERHDALHNKLIALQDQFPGLRSQIQQYIDKLEAIPVGDIDTNINLTLRTRVASDSTPLDPAQTQAVKDYMAANPDIYAKPHALGGIVDKATFALIGEAGRELVLPLTNMPRTIQLLQESGLLRSLSPVGGVGSTLPFSQPLAFPTSKAKQEATNPIEATVDNSRHFEFHGDLSFPNITSPDDADAFIHNLETLVG